MPDLTDENVPGEQPERPAALPPAGMDGDASQPRAAVVVRAAAVPARTRWSGRVATMAARLPDLARNPAVLATATVTATVAGEVAVGILRRALGGGAGRPGASNATVHISAVVVHRVHVVHHHVVHPVEPRVVPGA